MSLDIKTPILAWSRKSPSRHDALLMLALSLDLIHVMLPLAFESIINKPPHEQLDFWWRFIDFEKESDLDGHGGGEPFDIQKIQGKLSEWSEVCRLRAGGEKGDLDAEESLDTQTTERPAGQDF